MQSALPLIVAHDVKRYKRAIASFDRIWVNYLFGSVGQYVPERRRCQLDPGFVLSSPIETIASTIVHEATHARFINVGIPNTYENLHRVEKACIRQELVFAQRIPEAEELRRRINAKLLLDPDVWSRKTSPHAFARHFRNRKEAFQNGSAEDCLKRIEVSCSAYPVPWCQGSSSSIRLCL